MKGNFRGFIPFLFFVLFFVNGYSQIDISGRVLDAQTREVLIGANIIVKNSKFGTATDNSGFFRFFENEVQLPCTLEIILNDYQSAEFVVSENQRGLEFLIYKKEDKSKRNLQNSVQQIDTKELNKRKTTVKLNISGRVFDERTKEPLVGVNLVVKNTVKGTASDNSGFFLFKTDEFLPCVIQISMIGYQTREVLIEKNQTNLELLLAEETILSEEVVVRAKEIEVEQKNFQRIATMEMMDALTIRETASSNFYEAIGHLKGVDVVMQSMNFMTVNARGFNSTENSRFVQIVDGMDNMAPGMNFPIGNIAGLNELDVESIEFVPGPAEVQYGGNALNGILIMKSKDPFEHQGISMYLKPGVSDIVPGSDYPFQFSGKPQWDGGLRIAKAFNDKFAFKINASYSQGIDWYADDTTNIRPGNIKWEYDPGHDAINKYGDEVISDLAVGERGENIIVSRTGYRDKELVDNDVNNLKLNGAIHVKITPKTTAIIQANYGSATTVYTGDNRTSLSGFKIYQGKAEIKGDHFMLRGYSSFQNAGNSYDAKFLAVHLNERAATDEQWFHDYYHSYKGNFRRFGVPGYDYKQARIFADRNRLIPGTPEFEDAKNEIINNTDFTKGAGIYNNSALHNIDGSFDLGKFTEVLKITIGGNYRFFDLDSRGSIFPDTTGNNITIYEFGVFSEFEKKLIDDRLTLKASLRFDKSENFEGHFSPRLSALYEINNDNNIRFAVLTGYRNPGVKEQFINKDLGTARYLGGLDPIKTPYQIAGNSFYLDDVNAFSDAVTSATTIDGGSFGLNQAIHKNLNILENGIVSVEDIAQIIPERVFSFEVGYKTKIKDVLYLDAVYYNSMYRDFIGISKVVKPRTSPQVNLFAAATQVSRSAENDVYFLNVNSQKNVGIQGVAMGYKWLMPMGSILSGNLTWSDIRTEIDDPVAPGFNTPGFKSNLSLQNRKMDRMENNPGFRNVGFKVTWRYQSRYYWESTFGDGYIEPVSTFDVQFSLNIGKPKSLVKIGASNFFNNSFVYSFGGSNIGVLYYVSYVMDNIFNLK